MLRFVASVERSQGHPNEYTLNVAETLLNALQYPLETDLNGFRIYRKVWGIKFQETKMLSVVSEFTKNNNLVLPDFRSRLSNIHVS